MQGGVDVARVLITGAGGRIGRVLGARLPSPGWAVRLLDVAPQEGGGDVVQADIRDAAAMDSAMAGVSAVVHLAAISHDADFRTICDVNIEGTYELFEAARRAGIERFVYASTNHVVGLARPSDGPPPEPRPDGLYGVSKLFGEALGRLYADRFGMRVACVRIGSFAQRPTRARHLATWLSHSDGVRLFHVLLSAPDLRYAVVYGISANTRRWWDLEPARRLGYEPVDDAEVYVDEVLAEGSWPDGDPEVSYQGGHSAWSAVHE
jgi:uronate dehydrogenase